MVFSEQFSQLMQRRGFKSDEQLALRAMSLQRGNGPRINVQARTINNWRNGRTQPRSLEDRQLALVLETLRPCEFELQTLRQGLEIYPRPAKVHDRTGDKKDTTSIRLPIGVAIGILAALAIAWSGGLFKTQPQQFLVHIPPSQLRLSRAGFVLPNSDTVAITESKLAQLTSWELYVARNEIFARYGRRFVKPYSICLQNHFDKWQKDRTTGSGWYVERSGNPLASDLEYANAVTIRNHECNLRGGQIRCDGKLTPCK